MPYRIDRLGHLGDGIAEGPVFAPRTLPGELIDGTPEGGRIPRPRILEPSDRRIKPACRHYKSCGGCALQHADEGFVASWKRAVVAEALAAQGLAAEITGPATSPPKSRRRATLSGRRTKSGATVGFHGQASDQITEIEDCHVLAPQILASLPGLRHLVTRGASRKAEVKLAVTVSAEGLDVSVTGGKPLVPALNQELVALAARHRFARLSWDGEVIVTLAPPVQQIGAGRVVPPPGGFLQATPEGEAALTQIVTEGLAGAASVVDLFSGCGTFTLPLAAQSTVHAVESETAALEALETGWRHAKGLRQITTEARDLFRRPLLPEELAAFDAAVIDPPRAGAEAQMQELAASALPRIAMVSCNPTTFARDAKILGAGGYRLSHVHVVDQFRWSPHVELAALLSRGE